MSPHIQKTLDHKKLCGIFISALMAASGCGRNSPENGNAVPPHPHDNAELMKSGIGDEFLTDEERINQPVRFDKIATEADPRTQRLIVQLQRSSLGREIYNYAIAEKLILQWEIDNDKRAGVYYHDKDLIVLDARNPDDDLLSTLVHEIRHAWQYRELGVTEWILSPQDRWRASRLVEADSCAFSMHFGSVHEQETGHQLDVSYSFNRLITESYMYTPRDQRNYLTGAVEPCFERVNYIYGDMHMETVKTYFDRSAKAYNDVANSGSPRKYRRAFQSAFDTPDTQKKAALFSAFINITFDPKTGAIADIKSKSPDEFLNWLEKQTPVDNPANAAELGRMQTEFDTMRNRLLHGPDNATPDLPETPAPAPRPSI